MRLPNSFRNNAIIKCCLINHQFFKIIKFANGIDISNFESQLTKVVLYMYKSLNKAFLFLVRLYCPFYAVWGRIKVYFGVYVCQFVYKRSAVLELFIRKFQGQMSMMESTVVIKKNIRHLIRKAQIRILSGVRFFILNGYVQNKIDKKLHSKVI